jgi:hypothetical protein
LIVHGVGAHCHSQRLHVSADPTTTSGRTVLDQLDKNRDKKAFQGTDQHSTPNPCYCCGRSCFLVRYLVARCHPRLQNRVSTLSFPLTLS